MKSKEIKKRLKERFPTLRVPFFKESRILLFDPEFTVLSLKEMIDLVNEAVLRLVTPVSEYKKFGRDCDNVHLSIWSGTLDVWQSQQSGDYFSIPFGFASGLFNGQNHAWNIAVCTDGIYSFNYGEYFVAEAKPYKFIAM